VQVPAVEWQTREESHRQRVGPHAEAFVQRRARGEKHPVWDFLFTYYSFSPGKLTTWVPALSETAQWANISTSAGETISWEWPAIRDRDIRQAQWVAQLCQNVLSRPARFQCHGLHEWAMVYKLTREQVRHNGYTLRLSAEELAAFIDSQQICCSHYDAYRFFTPEASPLNTLKPELETRLDLEQGGCLHTNMDLYKWAYKLWPWIGSDIVADTFELALAGRAFDMRASPYDLASLGFDPIPIETAAGREEYRREQERLAALAVPVRERLQQACLDFLAAVPLASDRR